ncbi:MAG: HD domain-containing protein [Fimbriimonadaceae bacterium]|nr:HD domain-containing protein [Fimbriimonadaceae bacterium]
MHGERFEAALVYAAQVHGDHSRKGSKMPYIGHLLAVAGIVIDYGGDEDCAIAALLHDAVEDRGGQPRLADIRERFGERVAAIVLGCSDTEVTPKPPWRQRKELYIAHVPTASPEVLLVSSADKLHNALSIWRDYRREGAATFERFRGGQDGTLWYYRALVEAYRVSQGTPVLPELEQVVAALEREVARGNAAAG